MNLPNKLTVFRIILIPVFILIMVLPLSWGQVVWAGTTIPVTQVVATVIFAVASLTDLADGKIARVNTWLRILGSLRIHWQIRC